MKKMLRGGLLTGLAATLLVSATGCALTAGNTAEGGGYTIGVVDLVPMAFTTDFDNGAQARADELGVSLSIANSDSDPAKEAELVSQFVAKQVDAIVISAVSPSGSAVAIQQAVDAGIPVICANTCLTEEDTAEHVNVFVTSNQQELGSETGKAVVEYVQQNLGGTANIAMLTCEQLEVCQERRAGIDKELEAIDVEIVATQEAFEADTAATAAATMFTAHPEIDILIAENDGGLDGGVAALTSRNTDRPVAAFGIDISPRIAGLLTADDGILQMTTAQAPVDMGAMAVQAAVDVLNGESPDDLQFSPSVVFTRDDTQAITDYLATQE